MSTSPTNQDSLSLVAFDNEDLEIISTHCQDAIVRVVDIAFIPHEQRFALMLNRFDWENTIYEKKSIFGTRKKKHRRRRTALRFECVKTVQHRNISLTNKTDAKELLAIQFTPNTAPHGVISLVFAGNSEIKLEVECIEAILQDQGAIWQTKSKPNHPVADET